MLIAKNICKSFNNINILNGIDIKMEKGKISMFIGGSGCGKTVLMKILLGLFKPEIGEVIYENESFYNLSDKDKKHIRSEIGMVFQGSALFDSLSVVDNVMMPLNFHTNEKYNIKLKRTQDALDRVQLLAAINKKPNELSGGMRKRVAIARAIVLGPKYFFCDEPNSGLDPLTSSVIDNLIQDLTIEKNMTTVINTHDMNSAFYMGDKICFIKNGKIIWQGNNADIKKTNNLDLQKFILPQKNFLDNNNNE